MTPPSSRPTRAALHAYVTLMRASGAVTQRVHGHLAEAELTVTQFAVMEAALHLGPLRQCDLAGKLLSSQGNLTTVIDNLERDGWVERRPDPDDRRAKRIHLTRPGRRRIQTVFPRHAEEIRTAFAALTAAEQATLARLCKKLGRSQTLEHPQ